MVRGNPDVELLQSQRRIWFIEETFRSSPMFNIGGAVLFQSPIREDMLERAILASIARHDGMRMQLAARDGEPRQYISERIPECLDKKDFSKAPDPEAAFRAWLREVAETPFPLHESELYRFVLVRVNERESGYLLKFHHLIADGWSMKIVTEDIVSIYERLLAGGTADLPPAPSFTKAIEDERKYLESERFHKNKVYWLDKFKALPENLTTIRESSGYEARRRTIHLSARSTGLIRQWTSRTGLSENVFFATLAGLYFGLSNRSDELVLGVPVLNRSGREERQTIGMFASLMPLRIRIDRDMTTAQFAAEVGREMKSGFYHQRYPYNYLVRDLQKGEGLSGQLAEVCVNYSHASLLQEYGGLPVRNVDFFPGFQTYNLHLLIKDWGDERIRIDIEYKTGIYMEAEIDAMSVQLEQLAERTAAEPDLRLDMLGVAGEDEIARLLAKGSGPEVDVGPFRFIDEWLAHQARVNPALPALRFRQQRLAYKQVDETANRVAAGLSVAGVREGDIVGLIMERSPETVELIFGILRAGAAYMPLDPAFPSERIKLMLDRCGAFAVIAGQEQYGTVSGLHPKTILAKELLSSEAFSEGTPMPVRSRSPHSPAYVIFTSGSTGEPKGVLIEHAALINRLMWMQRQYPLEQGDVVLHKTPFTFDVSVWELLWWTIGGAECCILPHGGEKDPELIAETIETSKVTVAHFVPSMLGAFLTALEAGLVKTDGLRSLRSLFASGEALPADYVRRCHKLIRAELHNLYGPTEAAIDVTYFDCLSPYEDVSVPIGKPIANIRLYVVDESLRLVPDGAEGELCIAGAGLARGYIGDAGLTDSKFVRLPQTGERIYRTGDGAKWLPDGNLAYLGRLDNQVKIRGYRIEPGEIELSLLANPFVKEAAVAVRKDAAGEKSLCAYIVADPRSATLDTLREHLLLTLPYYMIPARFVFMDSLPLTLHGKLDRKALPEVPAENARESAEEPVGGRYGLFLDIVRSVLGTEGIGWADHFLHAGGDSIKAIQVAAKLHERGLAFPAQRLLDRPILREAAAALQEHADRSVFVRTGTVKPTPIIEWFSSKGHAEPNHFNQSVVLKPLKEIDPTAIRSALDDLQRAFDVFGLAVRGGDHGHSMLYYREEPVPSLLLETVDLSGPSERSLMERLEDWAGDWKAGIDWNNGPLLKAAWVKLPAGERRLLLTAHHLIVDGVTWRLIVDRLNASIGGSADAYRESAAFGEYAERLHVGPAKEQALQELSYWLSVTAARPVRLSEDGADPAGELLEHCGEARFTLEEDVTALLLGAANDTYRTRPQELILAGFALAAGQVAESGGLLGLMLEGHGRESSIADGLPINGTAGWFTSIYPVNVQLADKQGIQAQIESVKRSLRAVPGGGTGYGMLAYLLDELEPADEQERIRFNYLGEIDAGLYGEWFTLTDESYGRDVSPANKLGCILDVNVHVLGGKLHGVIAYSRNVFGEEAASGLVRQWKDRLEAVIHHCTEQRPAVLAASDFEWSGLNQEELDGLF